MSRLQCAASVRTRRFKEPHFTPTWGCVCHHILTKCWVWGEVLLMMWFKTFNGAFFKKILFIPFSSWLSIRCKQQQGCNSCYPRPIAGRSDTWWKYFGVGKSVRLIWACCSPLWTVIIPWTKLRRMMCAQGLRSSALLCGKSASKNTVFLPLMSVCFRAHSDPLSLSQTARKETLPFYLQTSLSVSSVSQQDAAST